MRTEPAGGKCEAERQSHVTSEMNMLEQKISMLQETVRMVHERIGSVMVISPPTPIKAEKQPEEHRVPLAEGIRQQRYRLQAVLDDVQDILNNCEL